MFHLQPILKPKELKRLKEHKYSSAGQSVLEDVMQRLWNHQINYIPLTVAPNLLTVLGLAANAFTTLLLAYFSPDARKDVPAWACLFCAFGLFIYQSLDALDGKQARRTGSSSPLGELFDHGCDSLSSIFAILAVCICTRMGTQPYIMLTMCLLALFVFYTAHWQTYVSGRLFFTSLNVTEAQFGVMIVLLTSAIFGTDVWTRRFTLSNGTVLPTLDNVIFLITIVGSVAICYPYLVVVFTGGAGKNKSTIAGTSVLSPAFPLAITVFAALAIFDKSRGQFERYVCLYVLTFGLVVSKLTDILVLAHMTKSELKLTDSILLAPAILALNQYYNHVLDERVALWLAFGFAVVNLTRYLISVCLEISKALDIPIFTIPLSTGPHSERALRPKKISSTSSSQPPTSLNGRFS